MTWHFFECIKFLYVCIFPLLVFSHFPIILYQTFPELSSFRSNIYVFDFRTISLEYEGLWDGTARERTSSSPSQEPKPGWRRNRDLSLSVVLVLFSKAFQNSCRRLYLGFLYLLHTPTTNPCLRNPLRELNTAFCCLLLVRKRFSIRRDFSEHVWIDSVFILFKTLIFLQLIYSCKYTSANVWYFEWWT